MNTKAVHNGYCLNCGRESIKPFCKRKCYLGYIRKGLPFSEKEYEKQQRNLLTDRIVKRDIYIASNGKIKYSDMTPEMIAEKRAQILAYRQHITELRQSPEYKASEEIKYCKICNAQLGYKQSAYCSDECRAERDRRYHHTNKIVILKRMRDKYRDAWIAPLPYECRECGKIHQPEYGDKHDKYCSNKCAKRNMKRNQHHARRVRLRSGLRATVYKARIFKRDKGICQICGKKVAFTQKAPYRYSASLDHIIPLSKGGTHEPKNVRLAHFICNSIKGDRTTNGGDQLLLFG